MQGRDLSLRGYCTSQVGKWARHIMGHLITNLLPDGP
jgi:hypothetical protein